MNAFLECSLDQKAEALAKGYNERYFFPHQVYFLPKCGPDGFRMTKRLFKHADINSCWEGVLFAMSPVLHEFPIELFFDSEIMYHQQQFGKPGQIATVNLFIDGDRLYTMVHQSDLVQRISRRREWKTRIENRFKGWNLMLWNSIMNFAHSRGLRQVCSPTADFAMKNSARLRTVQPEMFNRIYDRDVNKLFATVKEGQWWCVDVQNNRHRVFFGRSNQEALKGGKTICICHDIERGLGHLDVDGSFAKLADETAPRHLLQMLQIENQLNVKASYNVVGSILNDVREQIVSGGHGLGFHSYDHQVGHRPQHALHKVWNWFSQDSRPHQLRRCREVDQRLKGYRTPRSYITPELKEENLCHFNFEWIASSASSLKIKQPVMQNRIVKIPILFGDFKLYKLRMNYEEWERKALKEIESSDFFAIDFHDCYGEFWLPYYEEFLAKVSQLGTLKTLDQVSGEIVLANAQ